MRVETWLPLATLVLGWAGAQITEMLRDHRASERERQAHDRERKDRQGEIQRATLLDLQDALLELSNRTSEIHATHIPAMLGKDIPQAVQQGLYAREGQARTRLGDTVARVRLLESRVLDADARRAVTSFVRSIHFATPWGKPAPEEDRMEVSRRYAEAIERLGELIRERY